MQEFEQWFTEQVAPGEKRLLPGAVCLAGTKDDVFYSKCFGTKSVNPESPLSKEPLTPDTTMWIASCTKLLTSLCILKLVESGLVNLDDDVAETGLPELKNKPILTGFDDNDDPIYKPSSTKITLRLMLSHQSGIGYGFFQPPLIKFITTQAKKSGKPPLDGGDVRSIFDLPLLSEPGTQWAYGCNLEWAGLLLNRKTGKTLHQYMDEHIWQPLGMKTTTFRLEQRDDIKNARADMTLRVPDVGTIVPSPTRYWPDETKDDMGGGGITGSPADYMKLLQAILRNDGTLAKPETIDMLFEPQLSQPVVETMHNLLYNFKDVEALSTNLPKSANVTHTLGGMLNQEAVVGDVFGNGGRRRSKGTLNWGGLPNLMWTIDREAGVVLFYGSQILPPGDGPSIDAFRRFEEAVYKGLGEKAAL
ncbi:beta-lactamase family protein [Sporormia fimetaria CBS 119925]|uniref:Beta-lactamase family protein n=1 Tax=Sporormia fimetaria CBS 119925 TaxID=1340428 RepID=A0A6A6VK28_9PLEO|nr:beta-lactamase family protein [Sporormia fimetaria CBS 119925]